ncbi:MAG: hypothetical protein OXC00_13995 [Acidimicrobiaceae bacterium]|nr:hypothetical protein [Acidimicrobiaceae bacterium]
MSGTHLITRTKIELQDEYDDFETAWAAVNEKVLEFVREHPRSRVILDDTTGMRLSVTVLAR